MDEPILKSGQWPNVAIDPRTGRHAATGEEVEMTDNATDELRRLLDERGVEAVDNMFGVTWDYYSNPHTAAESMDGTLIVSGLTPSQAIAATLGSEPPRKVYIVESYDSLTEGGYVEPTCYTSKQAAIRRAESQTYEDGDGVYYWAHWKELKVVER